jgi:septal ring factor EnvC (AmiA/AmiB activator)
MRRVLPASIGLGAVALLALAAVPGHPQSVPLPETSAPALETEASRIDARIRALEREADDLAGRARTLLGELQKLEVERSLRREQAARADAAARAAMSTLRQASQRVADLEQQRIAQLPAVEAQLVEIYKHGRNGYSRLLFGSSDARAFGRLVRLVGALNTINERRMAAHRRTLDALREERGRLEAQVRELQARDAEAKEARTRAERAVSARAALIAEIDAQRDLTAQYVGELQTAYTALQQRLADLEAGGASPAGAVPLAPFRGTLGWPVTGTVSSTFGEGGGRLGGTSARNGIEIASEDGAIVQAVYAGTVGFADVFPGFGRLVILEHGGNAYSLYGYLGAVSVTPGTQVEAGAEIGRVGLAPAGPPALYFELRVDGQSTDPLQWLKPSEASLQKNQAQPR